jgi:hypothetical protein
VRNKIIFKGSSHTIGLGLDLELSNRYNDDDWLKENGIILPRPAGFIDEDWYHINNNRWPKKVCEDLGKEEHDFKNEILSLIIKSNPKKFSDKLIHQIQSMIKTLKILLKENHGCLDIKSTRKKAEEFFILLNQMCVGGVKIILKP